MSDLRRGPDALQIGALLAIAALIMGCRAHQDQGLFGNTVQLPDDARTVRTLTGLSTRLHDLIQRRNLLGTSSYGYYYGEGGGYGS